MPPKPVQPSASNQRQAPAAMTPQQQRPASGPLRSEIDALRKMVQPDIVNPIVAILKSYISAEDEKVKHIIRVVPYELYDKATISWQNVDKVCDQIFYVLENSKRVLELELRQQQALLAESASLAASAPASTLTAAAAAAASSTTPATAENMDVDGMEAELEPEGGAEPVDVEEAAQLQRERITRLRVALGIAGGEGEEGEVKTELLF